MKSYDKDDFEALRGEYRRLVKENKALKREMNKLIKRFEKETNTSLYGQPYSPEEDLEESCAPMVEERRDNCSACGSSDVTVIPLIGNLYLVCSECKHKQRTK